jgi:hypothetical protein
VDVSNSDLYCCKARIAKAQAVKIFFIVTVARGSAVSTIAGRAIGDYEYRSELVNAGGVTSSDKITVKVTK